MDSASWLGPIITVASILIGLAIQGAGLAYLLGQMKERERGQERLLDMFKTVNAQALDAMTQRLRDGDERFEKLGTEMVSVKVAVGKMETRLEGHEASCEDRQRRTDEGLASVGRRIDGNIAMLQGLVRGELSKL
jgi:predicted RNase H-like nuclease (RuvC/YqgF family)